MNAHSVTNCWKRWEKVSNVTHEEARTLIDEMRAEIKAKHMCRSMDGECTSEEVAEYRCRFAALSMAIEALEKQIPKNPKEFDSVPVNRCPKCNDAVRVYSDNVKLNYCPWCGQALDWSE